ncbi:hypothetical protein C8Q76DRAFT_701398 [Earliella scabrosa]|nr:hypothetical protein C8Q76DRAFT_701398 [Earliella scabrosa]
MSANASNWTSLGHFTDFTHRVQVSSVALYYTWTSILLSSAFFGALTVCVAIAACILISKGLNNRSSTVLLFAIAAMYATTAAHWVFFLVSTNRQVLIMVTSAQNLVDALNCLPMADDSIHDCAVRDHTTLPYDLRETARCVGTAALTVNIILGDAIVWWRAWVVWKGDRAVRVVCAVCLLATAAVSICAAIQLCNATAGQTMDLEDITTFLVAPLLESNLSGVAATALSLANNVIATSLVGHVAWRHRALIREHLKFRSRPSQVERALSLLVESGVGYCIVWIVMLAYQCKLNELVKGHASYDLESALKTVHFIGQLEYFVEGALIPFVAIYPTLIVIIVSKNRGHCDTQFTYQTAGLQVPAAIGSLCFREPQRSTSDARSESGHTNEDQGYLPPV